MQSVLDATAILALLLKENGQANVTAAMQNGAAISTVNRSEVVARLVRDGVSPEIAIALLNQLPVEVADLDVDLADRAGAMISVTKPFGLSLGDRCCLALAARMGVPALTADREWLKACPLIGVDVRLIR